MKRYNNNLLTFNLRKKYLHNPSAIKAENNSKSTINTESNFNSNLTNFLSQVSVVSSENKNDLYKAQLTIEEKCYALCLHSFALPPPLPSSKRNLIYHA